MERVPPVHGCTDARNRLRLLTGRHGDAGRYAAESLVCEDLRNHVPECGAHRLRSMVGDGIAHYLDSAGHRLAALDEGVLPLWEDVQGGPRGCRARICCAWLDVVRRASGAGGLCRHCLRLGLSQGPGARHADHPGVVAVAAPRGPDRRCDGRDRHGDDPVFHSRRGAGMPPAAW